ncbi:hypothetical protein [Reyranella sp.]|uniref:hypothetical protein n=1 Tax=Reyranella sp. TaxID=1929291 RepID=UPI0037837606
MKSTIVAAILATAVTGSAAAQTAEFKCPTSGTQFSYRGGAFEKVMTATGQDGNVCLFRSVSDGKTESLRVHGGLVGSVDAQGEAFARGLDITALWPLKVGNKTTNTVTLVGRDGKSYTSTVSLVVAAYEKVAVPAGTFEAFRVEEIKAGESARNIHWWAPALAVSVKESFPDWHDLSKVTVLELTTVKPPAW